MKKIKRLSFFLFGVMIVTWASIKLVWECTSVPDGDRGEWFKMLLMKKRLREVG